MEPLTDKELYRALKNDDFASMYDYCFVNNGFDFSSFSQRTRVEYWDVSYRSFTEYFKELNNLRKQERIDSLEAVVEWEQLFGNEETIINQLDSLIGEKADDIRCSLASKQQKYLPNSIWYLLLCSSRQFSFSFAEHLDLERKYNPNRYDIGFLIYKETINPFIEPFGSFFCDTYFFENSELAKKYPKESLLFQRSIDADRSPISWPWVAIYYELYELSQSSFPTSWKLISNKLKAIQTDILEIDMSIFSEQRNGDVDSYPYYTLISPFLHIR